MQKTRDRDILDSMYCNLTLVKRRVQAAAAVSSGGRNRGRFAVEAGWMWLGPWTSLGPWDRGHGSELAVPLDGGPSHTADTQPPSCVSVRHCRLTAPNSSRTVQSPPRLRQHWRTRQAAGTTVACRRYARSESPRTCRQGRSRSWQPGHRVSTGTNAQWMRNEGILAPFCHACCGALLMAALLLGETCTHSRHSLIVCNVFRESRSFGECCLDLVLLAPLSLRMVEPLLRNNLQRRTVVT